MTRADLHRLVDELPDDAVVGASVLVKNLVDREVDPDQAWAWTIEWREQLRKSLEDLRVGRTEKFTTTEEFLQAL